MAAASFRWPQIIITKNCKVELQEKIISKIENMWKPKAQYKKPKI